MIVYTRIKVRVHTQRLYDCMIIIRILCGAIIYIVANQGIYDCFSCDKQFMTNNTFVSWLMLSGIRCQCIECE